MALGLFLLLACAAWLCVGTFFLSKAKLGTTAFCLCLTALVAALAVRVPMLSHQTYDYLDFLSRWVQFFREIGGFDDKTFFLHFEDADISRRARARARLLYLPQFAAVHMWERDTAKHASSFLIMLKSMFRYFGKWGWRIA